MSTLYSPKITTNGLVLALDAANYKSYSGGGATWKNLVDVGSATIGGGGPGFTGSFGGGLVFNGINNYGNISAPGGFNSTGSFTYDIWFKLNGTSSYGSNGGIILGNNARSDGSFLGGSGNGCVLSVDTANVLRIYTFSGGGATDYNTGFNVANGEICHVGFIHNSLTGKVGVKNGVLSQSEASWSTQHFPYFTIGGYHSESSYFSQLGFSNIHVYKINIYNRALSATEINHNYNAVKTRFGL